MGHFRTFDCPYRILFGDIGIPLLHTMREARSPPYGLVALAANVLGVLSLIIPALINTEWRSFKRRSRRTNTTVR